MGGVPSEVHYAHHVLEGIATEVIGGLVLVILGALGYYFRDRLRGLIARGRITAREAERVSAADEIRVLRGQVIEVAKARNITVPERSSGHNPTGVLYTNGQTTWFFRDLASRRHAAGRNPAIGMNSTHLAPAPLPVSKWTAATCRKWLEMHAD